MTTGKKLWRNREERKEWAKRLQSEDPNGYDKIVERRLMLDSLDCHLREEGLTEIRQVYRLLQWGYSWEHIAKQLGEADGEPIRKRYSRWVKRMTLRHNPQQL